MIQDTQLYPIKPLPQWLLPYPTPLKLCTVCYEYYVKKKTPSLSRVKYVDTSQAKKDIRIGGKRTLCVSSSVYICGKWYALCFFNVQSQL